MPPITDMERIIPIRKNIPFHITPFVRPEDPTVPEYPATIPMTEKLQPQVKTLMSPSKKTAISTVIPAWSELKILLIHSSINFYFSDSTKNSYSDRRFLLYHHMTFFANCYCRI